MADGCRSIFHRLNCITAPKIICPAYGEAACSYSNPVPVPYKAKPAPAAPHPNKAAGAGLGEHLGLGMEV